VPETSDKSEIQVIMWLEWLSTHSYDL